MPMTRAPELAVMRTMKSRISGVISGLFDIRRSIHCCCSGPVRIWTGIDNTE